MDERFPQKRSWRLDCEFKKKKLEQKKPPDNFALLKGEECTREVHIVNKSGVCLKSIFILYFNSSLMKKWRRGGGIALRK